MQDNGDGSDTGVVGCAGNGIGIRVVVVHFQNAADCGGYDVDNGDNDGKQNSSNDYKAYKLKPEPYTLKPKTQSHSVLQLRGAVGRIRGVRREQLDFSIM